MLSFSFHLFQYPFLMSIFQFIQTFSGIYYKPQSLLLTPLLNSSSHLLAFFQEDLVLVLERKEGKEKGKQKRLNKKGDRVEIMQKLFVFTKIEEGSNKRLRFYLLMLLLCVVNLFSHSLYMIYAQLPIMGSLQSLWNILLTSLFCFVILKTKLYAHHYLALGIMTVDVCLYLGLQLTRTNLTSLINTYYSGWGLFILISFGYIIPTSFREVLEKYIINNYYLTSYRILLFEGIFTFIAFLIYILIIQFVQCENLGWLANLCYKSKYTLILVDIQDNFSYCSISTLFVWTYIFGVYLASYYRVETIIKLSPTHRFVCEMLGQAYWFIYNVSFGSNRNIIIWLDLVQVFLLLAASFIFNEIIIIHLCNLDFNTNKHIKLRACIDTSLATKTLEMTDSSVADYLM